MAANISRKALLSLAAAGASAAAMRPAGALATASPAPFDTTSWPVINGATAVSSAITGLSGDVSRLVIAAKNKKPLRNQKHVNNWTEMEAFLRYMADEIQYYRAHNGAAFPALPHAVEPRHKRADDEPSTKER